VLIKQRNFAIESSKALYDLRRLVESFQATEPTKISASTNLLDCDPKPMPMLGRGVFVSAGTHSSCFRNMLGGVHKMTVDTSATLWR
jgi:hypothetical protein